MRFALQARKNIGSQTAGARADLENAQAAPLGQSRCGTAKCRGHSRQPRRGEDAIAVKMLEQIGAGPGEENLHGILLSAHDTCEIASSCRSEERLGIMLGSRLEEIAQPAFGAVGPSSESARRCPTVARCGQRSALDQRVHETDEDAFLRFDNAERIR